MDMFSMGSDARLYNESVFAAETELENWVEFWRVRSPRRLNKKWQEDFLVIGHLSFYVEIRCQDMTSGD
jgi:hypothetical protein